MRLLIITAALASATRLAHADRDDAGRREADAHAERGVIAYDLGRYDEAIREFESAYELFPSTSLLFNLGQAHRKLGHCEDALRYYERYLAGGADPTLRRAVEDRIAELTEACSLKDRPPAPVIEPGAAAVQEVEEAAKVEEVDEEVVVDEEEVAPRWWLRVAGTGALVQVPGATAVPIGAEIAAARTRPVRDVELRLGGALGVAALLWQRGTAAGTSPVAAPQVRAGVAIPRGALTWVIEGGAGLAVVQGLDAEGHALVARGRRVGATAVLPALRLGASIEWGAGRRGGHAGLAVELWSAADGMSGDALLSIGAFVGIGLEP